MSRTPETDALVDSLNDDYDVEFATLTAHARKLETERDEAREMLAKALERGDDAVEDANKARRDLAWSDIQDKRDLVRQVNEAREQRDRLVEALESTAKDFVFFRSVARENGLVGTLGLESLEKAAEVLVAVRQCGYCDGTVGQDSGGFTPWGSEIIVKCGHCGGTGKEVIATVKGDKP